MSEIEMCQCSEEERAHFGVRLSTPGLQCKRCDLPTIEGVDDDICQCSEEERAHFGVQRFTPGQPCKKCKLPTVSIADNEPDIAKYSLTNNTLEEQEALVNDLINQMALGSKYRRALQEGKFASFSLTGTNDWEDYASSVFRIIMLKELMRISRSVEKMSSEVEKLREERDS